MFVSVEQLIAIVADSITDCTVISDLHSAASRGVVVYIILNRRPAKDNLTPNQLKHPVSLTLIPAHFTRCINRRLIHTMFPLNMQEKQIITFIMSKHSRKQFPTATIRYFVWLVMTGTPRSSALVTNTTFFLVFKHQRVRHASDVPHKAEPNRLHCIHRVRISAWMKKVTLCGTAESNLLPVILT